MKGSMEGQTCEQEELTFATIMTSKPHKAVTPSVNTVPIEVTRIWTLPRNRNRLSVTQFMIGWTY